MNTAGQFTPGDIVLISDLKGYLGYPVLGRVRSLEQDSDGIPRYFIIEYKRSRLDVKNKNREEKVSFSKKFMSVKRPANSLVVLIPKNEVKSENAIEDILNYCETDNDDVLPPKRRTKKKIQVSFQDCYEMMSDIKSKYCYNPT